MIFPDERLESLYISLVKDIGENKKPKLKVAVVKAGSRYGLLQPQETEGLNSRKPRQWLAFWLFPPNDNALQWLGPLSQCKSLYADILGSILSSFDSFFILFSVGHSTCHDKIDFPIKEDFADKRSYITPTVAWARNEFIQTDLTKLFQKARRLPGKELNLDREKIFI